MCPICPSLVQADACQTKLTPKFNQVQKGQFFQPLWQAPFGPVYPEQRAKSKAARSWAVLSPRPICCILAAEQPSPSKEVLYPHLLVRMFSWEVGCGLEGPVSEEPPTSQAMGIKGKEKLGTSSSFMTNGSHCQEQVWGQNSHLPSSLRHLALEQGWPSTLMA